MAGVAAAVFAGGLAVAAPPSPASPPPSTPQVVVRSVPGKADLDPRRAEAVEAALSKAVVDLEIPGLSAAVVHQGELRWSAGFGHADVENQVWARPESSFRFASISKPITATAVLRLVEEGKLDLDAPIQAYVPGFPVKPWPVTARQLLSHQSGIRNWTREEFLSTRRYETVADALVPFQDDPLLFEPGTRTEYTSFGFTLLGAAVAGASGAPFADSLRAAVFSPADMMATRVDDQRVLIPHRARGYRRVGGALRNSVLSDTSNRMPGGGLCGTAEDLGRFASALLQGRLLRPATFRAALTPQKLKSGRLTGFGLGWVLGRTGGRREAYHTGGQPQVSTVLYLLPDQGVAVALLANLEDVEDDLLAVARAVAARLA